MRLRGAGMGNRTALGTAAVVRVLGGMLMPPDVPLRVLEQRVAGRAREIPDVIVVAEDYAIAIAVGDTLTWANVVGIAAARVGESAGFSALPAVTGIPNLMEIVTNDMLLLLDAAHGVLLADPDPIAISQYQAEAEHLAPKRRLFLESAHLPAQTLDGRTIQVIAAAQNLEEVETALQNGADALYIPMDTENSSGFFMPQGYHILPAGADEATLKRNLFELIATANGKPILLADDYSLPLMLILEAASRAELTLALPLREGLAGLGFGELRAELQAAQIECDENETACELPRLAADLNDTAQFETLQANAIPVVLHVRAEQEDTASFEAAICHSAGTSIGELIFPAGQVMEAKTVIRGLNYVECRKMVSHALNTEEGA